MPRPNYGKYRLFAPLHRTRFADIVICRDPDLMVDVAVKAFNMRNDDGSEPEPDVAAFWRDRFLREARVLARIDHPHIAAVRELSYLDDGTPYMVMPFYPATLSYEIGKDTDDPMTLARLPKNRHARAIELSRALTILRQVLFALGEIHRQGLVHRDVKPGNLLLTSKKGGNIKLADFGMVQLPDDSAIPEGELMGTEVYASPEQQASEATVDPRADVYSAGVLGHRMIFGALPGKDKGRTGPKSETVPDPLLSFLDVCRDPDREKRPKDGLTALAQLERILAPLRL